MKGKGTMMLIDARVGEWRIAHLQNGEITEIQFWDSQDHGVAGTAHWGRVKGTIGPKNAPDGVVVRIHAGRYGDAEGFLSLKPTATLPVEGRVLGVRVQAAAHGAKLACLKPIKIATPPPDTAPALMMAAPNPLVFVTAHDDHEIAVQYEGPIALPCAGAVPYKATKCSLFDHYGVEATLEEALSPEVLLPCGGRLWIMETPACISIDVDRGHSTHAVCAINDAAVVAIARQIRLRQLAGRIVIDFMPHNGWRTKDIPVRLQQALQQQGVTADVLGYSRSALVEIIRARAGPSLAERSATPTHQAWALMRSLSTASPAKGSLTVPAPASVRALLQGLLREELTRTAPGLSIAWQEAQEQSAP